MDAVRVIPCLDMKDGRVVKGVHFVELRDAADPVEAARAYSEGGADEIAFLDITATVWEVTVDVACDGEPYVGDITTSGTGTSTLRLEFSPALPGDACCIISLDGDVVDDYAVATLAADCNRDLSVTTVDFSAVKARLGEDVNSGNFQYDVNTDGSITTVDLSAIKARLGNSLPSCP